MGSHLKEFLITILFLEAISPARTLSSEVLTATTSLLRCKPHIVEEKGRPRRQQT